jgi:apolipoprotein D and lipocalin family protein
MIADSKLSLREFQASRQSPRPGGRSIAASLLIALTFILAGCLGMPDEVTPVTGFEADRYLGKWYEIARLDHNFERGLTDISAQYSRREDGGIKVVNRGYSPEDEEWQQVEGKAYFVGPADEAYLKVSFFGPFYGSYVVFGLDRENYRHAFVSGPSHSYLWLLSRSPTLEPAVVERFEREAKRRGFDTDGLIFVEHSRAAD